MGHRGRAHGDYITRWQTMLDNLKPLLQDYPYLQDEFDELEQMLADCIETNSLQEKLKADLSVATEKIEKLYKDGDGVFGKILRHLKAELGHDSPKLKAFRSISEGQIDMTKEGFGDDEEKPPEEPVKPEENA